MSTALSATTELCSCDCSTEKFIVVAEVIAKGNGASCQGWTGSDPKGQTVAAAVQWSEVGGCGHGPASRATPTS